MSHILFFTGLESSCPYEKGRGGTLKTRHFSGNQYLWSQSGKSMMFVLPLTIQREDGNTILYLFSAAGLGFCYGATFIEMLMP